MKTLIVDDHALIRVFLKHYIEEHFPDFDVQILRIITPNLPTEIVKINPELLILDISLDELDSLDFFIDLKQQLPKTRFIIYTMHNISSYKNFFWKNGAAAYVLKEDAQSELKDIISRVKNGDRVFPSREMFVHTAYQLNQLCFSEKEKKILSALIESNSTEEISVSLQISKTEVLEMRHRLLEKTGAKNTQQLIKYTLDYNWIR